MIFHHSPHQKALLSPTDPWSRWPPLWQVSGLPEQAAPWSAKVRPRLRLRQWPQRRPLRPLTFLEVPMANKRPRLLRPHSTTRRPPYFLAIRLVILLSYYFSPLPKVPQSLIGRRRRIPPHAFATTAATAAAVATAITARRRWPPQRQQWQRWLNRCNRWRWINSNNNSSNYSYSNCNNSSSSSNNNSIISSNSNHSCYKCQIRSIRPPRPDLARPP